MLVGKRVNVARVSGIIVSGIIVACQLCADSEGNSDWRLLVLQDDGTLFDITAANPAVVIASGGAPYRDPPPPPPPTSLPTRRCFKCGLPEDNHNVRHPFVG